MFQSKDTGWLNGLKNSPSINMLPHFGSKNIHRLKVKRWKKILHKYENEKKARVVIFRLEKNIL